MRKRSLALLLTAALVTSMSVTGCQKAAPTATEAVPTAALLSFSTDICKRRNPVWSVQKCISESPCIIIPKLYFS